METSPIAKVVLGVWMLLPLTMRAETVLAVFTDREAFEKRLGGGLHVIGFDDIETGDAAAVAFGANHYAESPGAIITGPTDGGAIRQPEFRLPRRVRPVLGS